MNNQLEIKISGEKIPSVTVVGDSSTVRRSVKKAFGVIEVLRIEGLRVKE